MANQTLYEKALEIERKEEEIRKALVLGVKVDLNYLNEQLTKLRTEYAVLKLELTESLGPLSTDEP